MDNSSDVSERGPNFSKRETDILVDLIQNHQDVIENYTGSVSWQDKQAAWKQIADEFNSLSGCRPRAMSTIKRRYTKIKRDLRKTLAKRKKEQSLTGGGVSDEPPHDPIEDKIMAMCQLSMEGLDAEGLEDNVDENIEFLEDDDSYHNFLGSQKSSHDDLVPSTARTACNSKKSQQALPESLAVPSTSAGSAGPSSASELPNNSTMPSNSATKKYDKFLYKRGVKRTEDGKTLASPKFNVEKENLKTEFLAQKTKCLAKEIDEKTKVRGLFAKKVNKGIEIEEAKLKYWQYKLKNQEAKFNRIELECRLLEEKIERKRQRHSQNY